jgi:hypothetical protein
MAVFVSRGLAGGDENVPEPAVYPGFTDVDDTQWAHNHVGYWVEEGVAGGLLEGNYRRDTVVTRDHVAVHVARILEVIP